MGTEVAIEGLAKPAVVNVDGMYLFGNDGKKVSGTRPGRALFRTD